MSTGIAMTVRRRRGRDRSLIVVTQVVKPRGDWSSFNATGVNRRVTSSRTDTPRQSKFPIDWHNEPVNLVHTY